VHSAQGRSEVHRFSGLNGKVWPFLEVEPRKYRFRILNASNARFYHLTLKEPDRNNVATDRPARCSSRSAATALIDLVAYLRTLQAKPDAPAAGW
jgi:hypothetical protein